MAAAAVIQEKLSGGVIVKKEKFRWRETNIRKTWRIQTNWGSQEIVRYAGASGFG